MDGSNLQSNTSPKKMTTARRNHLTADCARSPFISERRRKLFPTEDQDMDSELGHISPIGSDSEAGSAPHDYDVINRVQHGVVVRGSETPTSNRSYSETMSPLKLSPYTSAFLRGTPTRFSPSQNLKTPHDTSTKPVLQREQKILLEKSKSLKRKGSPDSSPEPCKSFKSDVKSSKVRTALFPPEDALDISLSTKSFYSKNQEKVPKKLSLSRDKYNYKPVKFNTAKHNHRHSRRAGQINNGVGHKIRKPKQKKISKAVIAKATKKMLETGPALNEYLQDLTKLKNKQNTERKLIQPPASKDNSDATEVAGYLQELQQHQGVTRKQICSPPKQIQPLAKENKENLHVEPQYESVASPADKKARKFFKSSRPKPVPIKKQQQALSKEDEQPTHKLELAAPQDITKVTLDANDDFGEDETEPEANIDNILSVLSEESPQKNKDDFSIRVANDTETHMNQIQSSKVVFESSLIEASDTTVPATNSHRQQRQSSRIVLEAHNSITASENSIQLHQPHVADTILSPISQMCDVTSGLALNSPRKGRNISALLGTMTRASKMLTFNNDCRSTDMDGPKKLFPIFYKDAVPSHSWDIADKVGKRERNDVVKRGIKRFKALPQDQMLLDAGQKKFGITRCNECNIVYHMGDPNDEIQHSNYHNAHHVFRFAGWKNEHTVSDFQADGRIIRVLPTDSKAWIKKVKDLMELVNRDLGCYEMEYDISQSQVYLFIKNRTIAGCAVATVPKQGGHRMLSSLNGIAMCSEESFPIKCGISHVWVASSYRKQGIASALLDAVKTTFAFGQVLSNSDIALTSPTEAGSAFAEKYFKTPNYLIYYT